MFSFDTLALTVITFFALRGAVQRLLGPAGLVPAPTQVGLKPHDTPVPPTHHP